jgi:hypothetical protein
MRMAAGRVQPDRVEVHRETKLKGCDCRKPVISTAVSESTMNNHDLEGIGILLQGKYKTMRCSVCSFLCEIVVMYA